MGPSSLLAQRAAWEGPRLGKDASRRVQGGRVKVAQSRTIPPSPAEAVSNPLVEGREWDEGTAAVLVSVLAEPPR